METTASCNYSVRDGQEDDLDKFDAHDIVLVLTLQVHNLVKQLSKEAEDTIVLVERLQACEKPQKQLEVLPLASSERLLSAFAHPPHGLYCDFRLHIVSVKGDCGDERDFEGLFHDSGSIS